MSRRDNAQMQSRKLGLGLAVLAIAGAIVLFVVLSDSDSDSGGTTTSATTQSSSGEPAQALPTTIVVRGGKPVGGVQELAFEKGGRIRFIVQSDVAGEVHLHGYDIAKDVEAGGRVQFDVPASIEGVFEVELEQRVEPLAEVTVNP